MFGLIFEFTAAHSHSACGHVVVVQTQVAELGIEVGVAAEKPVYDRVEQLTPRAREGAIYVCGDL